MPHVMRSTLVVLLLLFPAIALAEYNQENIKRGIMAHNESFLVENWRRSSNGEGWIARTKIKNAVLSVGRKSAGIIFIMADSGQAAAAMLRCVTLGSIGMSPKNEAQKDKIFAVVQGAAQHLKKKTLIMNGVSLEVSPSEMGGNAVFSCILSPPPSK